MTSLFNDVLFIGKGVYITFILSLGSLLLGLAIAIPVSILRYKKIFLFPLNRLISFIRGTPIILQLSIIYFCLPTIGIRLSILSAGVLAFGINSFAYVAEILRAGIEDIPSGQFEAAKTLNIPTLYTWKDIILPQVFKKIMPAIIGEIISLLKESAIIGVIGGHDIMRSANIIAMERFEHFLPLCIASGYYYFLVLIIEYLGKKFV